MSAEKGTVKPLAYNKALDILANAGFDVKSHRLHSDRELKIKQAMVLITSAHEQLESLKGSLSKEKCGTMNAAIDKAENKLY